MNLRTISFNLICVVALLVSALCLFFSARMAYGDTAIDSSRIAAALVSHPVESYWGNFNYTQMSLDGTERQVSGYFDLTKDGQIPNLWLSDNSGQTWSQEVGPGDKPLDGFPNSKAGNRKNFWLGLTGQDGSQQSVSYGTCWLSLLKNGDPIVVTLRPVMKEHFIPFTPPANVSVTDLVAEIEGGGGMVSYDPTRQGFDLWLDPATDPTITIRDNRTGIEYRSGTIGDLSQASKIQPISLLYEGAVRELFSGDRNWFNLKKGSLDGQVVDQSGQVVPADVYMFQLEQSQAAWFYFGNLSNQNGTIWVYAVDDSGDLSLTNKYDMVSQAGPDPNSPFSMTMTPPEGYDKFVVIVRDLPSYSLMASRYDNSGGKG